MFFLLSVLGASDYVEITEANRKLIGGEKPIFVKFYSPNCGHCKAMAADFAEAATMSKEVDFGGVECTTQKGICNDYNIGGYPTIILFDVQNKTGKEFTGHERSVDGFLDFIEETLKIKTPRPPVHLKELTSHNFWPTVNATKCSFITFYAPWCGHCKRFIPQAKVAANAFVADNSTVSFGKINCEKFKGFCDEHDVHGFPTIKLFVDGQPVEYSGTRTAEDVAEFVNKRCGTERAATGLLTDNAGILAEMKDIVQEFLTAEDKQPVIEKAKALKADLYVNFMTRIVNNGLEKSKADLEKMNQILVNRTVSLKVLDNIKRRFNVFQQCLGERKEVPAPAEEKTETAPAPEQPKAAETQPAAEQPPAEQATTAEENL